MLPMTLFTNCYSLHEKLPYKSLYDVIWKVLGKGIYDGVHENDGYTFNWAWLTRLRFQKSGWSGTQEQQWDVERKHEQEKDRGPFDNDHSDKFEL